MLNMADYETNKYLCTERAENNENDLFAAIGKRVLGLHLGDDERPGEDDRVKIVDEIEGACMNCPKNVSIELPSMLEQGLLTVVQGRDATITYKDSLLPRDYTHVLLL